MNTENDMVTKLIAGKDDKPTNSNEYPLLRFTCKEDETPSENGEEKYEKWETNDTAGRYFNSKSKDRQKPRRLENKKK